MEVDFIRQFDKIKIKGMWMPLSFKVEVDFEGQEPNSGLIDYDEIEVIAFVTTTNYFGSVKGIVGMSPGPVSMKPYNFGQKLMENYEYN